ESSKEPASHPVFLSKKQIKKEEERLTTELQLMTRERNNLKDRLMILTEGAVDNSPRKNHKPNALYEKVKMDNKQIMMELNNFENENTETLDNFKLLSKETVFYRDLHSRLLMERTQLKKKVDELRQEERKLQNDCTVLKYHLEDLKLIHNNQDEEISNLKIQQQKVEAIGQCPVDVNSLPIGSWATAALVKLLMAAVMVKKIRWHGVCSPGGHQ
ncbi:Disks large-like protein 5, partial [Microtus ochrogaster]